MNPVHGTKNILSIAGSDPSGGAGIQADLKSIAAAGGYGMAVISALTAQNTHGVNAVHVPPAGFLTEQLRAIGTDIRIDGIKIGMLANAQVINELTDWLAEFRGAATQAGTPVPAVVLDPVMVATSGDTLLDEAAGAALRRLFAHADVITPNIPELAVLAGAAEAADWDSAIDQARELAARYEVLVLAKGGHLDSARCRDGIIDASGVLFEVESARHSTANTHGTGCSLSSALATFYARSGDWGAALRSSKTWLDTAIARSGELEVGSGHGPINHLAGLWDGAAIDVAGDALQAWWERISPIRTAIDELGFIRTLQDGSLDAADFEDYLGQDAIYLRGYARAMSRAAALAPDTESQRFWAAAASSCLEEELALHRGRLAGPLPEPSPSTIAYLNHLVADADHYPVLVAAVLPCFWIYQDVGTRLAAANHRAHPYADWLSTYADPGFEEATAAAIALVNGVHAAADARTRQAMWCAFEASALHELAFFAQTAAEGPRQATNTAAADFAPEGDAVPAR
ncbi:bifunctional hydroxymethylpyrimidine kinase/phosphomethylpyrimidine kinase [Paeniglutamicibacter gangotriensis]|uniref:bifunctional hydroxymethylpyrimidine kinase/phosphomethylpyrimidine kinase n=1 Tax=Paeniglutamicibacter gangotriensis TaxID=254787 RepID=UPI0037C7D690